MAYTDVTDYFSKVSIDTSFINRADRVTLIKKGLITELLVTTGDWN